MVLDENVVKGILRITCSILRDNFFYSEEALGRFLDIFADLVSEEVEYCACYMDEGYQLRLKYDKQERKEFTCYFITCQVHDILVDFLYFSDLELDAFQDFLPRYTGAYENAEPTTKGTYH
jgi:hypothetical protein